MAHAAAPLLRGLRLTLVVWLLTVVLLPLPLLELAQLVAPDAANGNLLRRGGEVVGARWIGQPFRSARYLQGRPAGGAQRAAADPALAQRIDAAAGRWRRAGIAQPAADLLQDSASGVDPHLSLAAARQQLTRLARERRLSIEQLERLLAQHQEGARNLQAIEPVVNVLGFNLALDRVDPHPQPWPLRRPPDSTRESKGLPIPLRPALADANSR
jgi:K+-transporting ATPase ATPase C chain